MSQTTSEEPVQTVQPDTPPAPTVQHTPSGTVSISSRLLISVTAFALFASFFLPWTTFLGKSLSGLDLQQHFASYQLAWLLPACALLTFILNAAGLGTSLMRRVAGAIPFCILIYSLNRLGSDVWQIIGAGGWVALISGFVLEVLPSPPKPQPKA